MIYITDELIDRIIKEDMPFNDLTTEALGISKYDGLITFTSRQKGILSGIEIAKKIFEKLSANVVFSLNEGDKILPETTILKVEGTADVLHAGWKIALNTLEYLSGIASVAKDMTTLAKNVNPRISLAATRKSLPLSRELTTMAILAGGMISHRLGLSETILIFKNHLEFIGNIFHKSEVLESIKTKAPEKKIILETETLNDSLEALNFTSIDGIQLDKLSPNEVKTVVDKRNSMKSKITLLAAGGINLSNVEEYAKTGVEVLVTSSVFHAKPLDIKALIQSITK